MQQQQREWPHRKKQTYVMVQYMPLSTASGAHSDTYRGVHEAIPPPSLVGRCPKLTRYKTLCFLAVSLLSLILLTLMATRMQVARPYLNGDTAAGSTVGRQEGGREGETPSPGASPMCSLKVPQDGSISESVDGADGGNAAAGDGLAASVTQATGDFPSVAADTHPENSGVREVQANPSEGWNKDLGSVRRKRLPTAIVIGARKAGTRAVLRFVDLHPDIVTAKREPHFFDREYDQGLDWYRQQMPKSLPSQITLEKTPNYLVDWETPQRVYNFNSSIKLILIVRDPISRAVSDYVQLREAYYKQLADDEVKAYENGKPEPYPLFEELAIDQNTGRVDKSYAPIKRSLYTRHLERWLAFFNMSQILVLDGDNIRNKPWEEMEKVEDFLGLSHQIKEDCFVFNETKGFFCVKMVDRKSGTGAVVHKCLSESKGRKHPPIAPDVRSKLKDFFQPFNRHFFNKIGRTFHWD